VAGVDFAALQRSVQTAFAEPAIYAPANQPPFQVQGVFNRFMVQVRDMHDVPVTVPRTTLRISEADFIGYPAPRSGDRVMMRGETFDVIDPEADGFGSMVLILGIVG
jgi:hypothetical protein